MILIATMIFTSVIVLLTLLFMITIIVSLISNGIILNLDGGENSDENNLWC